MSTHAFAREITIKAWRKYLGKNADGSWNYETIPPRTVRVVVTVDEHKLVEQLGFKAAHNKSGRSTAMHGAIKVTAGAALKGAS